MMNKIIPIVPVVPVVQHADRAIKPKDYLRFGDNILISTVFRSVQGEGPLAGHPAVFIRTAGCNFGTKTTQCQFCDTNFLFDKGTPYSTRSLLDAAKATPGYTPGDILVITGGEPMLQHSLIAFIKLAQPHFSTIQIETNGTQAPFFVDLYDIESEYDYPTIVVSPKASRKANRYAMPSRTVLDNAACLKFVVTANANDPHHTVPAWAFAEAISRKLPIYVSPLAVYRKEYEGEVSSAWDAELIDQEATSKNYAYAAKYAMDNNCLLSIQQHLFCAVA
jgi:organic radical activating enzyme